jgi:hypothetical protein
MPHYEKVKQIEQNGHLGGEHLECRRTSGLRKSDSPHLDLGGGFGITVIYGVASPVKPPLMGQVWKYKATGVTTGYGKEKRSWNR